MFTARSTHEHTTLAEHRDGIRLFAHRRLDDALPEVRASLSSLDSQLNRMHSALAALEGKRRHLTDVVSRTAPGRPAKHPATYALLAAIVGLIAFLAYTVLAPQSIQSAGVLAGVGPMVMSGVLGVLILGLGVPLLLAHVQPSTLHTIAKKRAQLQLFFVRRREAKLRARYETLRDTRESKRAACLDQCWRATQQFMTYCRQQARSRGESIVPEAYTFDAFSTVFDQQVRPYQPVTASYDEANLTTVPGLAAPVVATSAVVSA
ncbi:MAG: hypothetical protein RhofKO_27530 [Rhodothermales bacterium]